MIYFGKKIRFEKESESMKTNLHDKEVKENKRILNDLIRVHDQTTSELTQIEKRYDEKKREVTNQKKLLMDKK